VAKDGFLKRANKDPKYEGHSVSCHTGPEGLVAVAKVYKKGFRNDIEVEVDFAEYVSLGKDGKPKALWATKPKTMLKKVALCQALRETFPDSLGGMYSREELNVDDLDSSPIVIDTRPIKPVSRLIEKPQVISDSRAWPEILEKYRPHLEDHGVSEVELGLMTADQFATLKGKVFGG
jgi:hypothetical protein